MSIPRSHHPKTLDIRSVTNDLITLIGLQLESATLLERQGLGCFLFGMEVAGGRHAGLSPKQLQDRTSDVLQRSLDFSPDEAVSLTRNLIQSEAADGNPTIKSIVSRGRDGYGQWVACADESLVMNVTAVLLALLRAASPPPS